MRLHFPNKDLMPLVTYTMEQSLFYIPYGDGKTTKNKCLALVKDAGIYLCTCAVDKEREKPMVCYAEGRGKDHQMSGDDYCEKIPLTPGLIEDLQRGADMVIDITGTSIKILTLIKPNQINNKNKTEMKKVKSIAEKAAEAEVMDAPTNDTTKKVKKKKKKKPATAEDTLDQANANKAAKDVHTERNTKYIYPDDVKSTKEKKDFRRKARATIEQFTKKIKKLTKSTDEGAPKELKTAEKEFAAWKAEFLSPEQ